MPERRDFAGRDELAAALSEAVAAALKSGVADRGQGSLVVSGGSTPAKFFAALSERADVPWERVTVTLADERWVDENHERSNARLVREELLCGPAAAARFVPLWRGGAEPDAVRIAETVTALAAVPTPFDAVILGMGGDGHTASFFPGGDTLADALTSPSPALAIRAPGAGEPRVTLTLTQLLSARTLFLHIEGEEKRRVLDKAQGEGPVEAMPVRAVLRRSTVPVVVYWSP